MKGILRNLYGTFLLLLFVAGEVCAVVFAAREGNGALALCLAGFVSSVILAPVLHEAGHVLLAKSQGMRPVFVKFFCFRFAEKEGKLRFSFASPFAPEETQVYPLRGGNMRRRTALYTAGGLIFGVIYLLISLLPAFFAGRAAFFFWGSLPYAGYLFLLNALPASYAGGRTDAAVLLGIAKGRGPERTMISAMEIYGELAEGKSFSEMDEKWFYGSPQIAEDEPMYAIILDFRYRRALEKGEAEGAADCLNRLGGLAKDGYLSAAQAASAAAEFGYMHALQGDAESARACAEGAEGAPKTALFRMYAAIARAEGDERECARQKEAAEGALAKEPLEGFRKSERILLSRI